jgi:hypothetical protein
VGVKVAVKCYEADIAAYIRPVCLQGSAQITNARKRYILRDVKFHGDREVARATLVSKIWFVPYQSLKVTQSFFFNSSVSRSQRAVRLMQIRVFSPYL